MNKAVSKMFYTKQKHAFVLYRLWHYILYFTLSKPFDINVFWAKLENGLIKFDMNNIEFRTFDILLPVLDEYSLLKQSILY